MKKNIKLKNKSNYQKTFKETKQQEQQLISINKFIMKNIEKLSKLDELEYSLLEDENYLKSNFDAFVCNNNLDYSKEETQRLYEEFMNKYYERILQEVYKNGVFSIDYEDLLDYDINKFFEEKENKIKDIIKDIQKFKLQNRKRRIQNKIKSFNECICESFDPEDLLYQISDKLFIYCYSTYIDHAMGMNFEQHVNFCFWHLEGNIKYSREVFEKYINDHFNFNQEEIDKLFKSFFVNYLENEEDECNDFTDYQKKYINEFLKNL